MVRGRAFSSLAGIERCRGLTAVELAVPVKDMSALGKLKLLDELVVTKLRSFDDLPPMPGSAHSARSMPA